MEFELLKDIKIMGVIHKIGKRFKVTDPDYVKNNTFYLCFGIGTFYPLKIGIDCKEIKEHKMTVEFHDNPDVIKFDVNEQTKDIIESLFWVIHDMPDDMSMSVSEDRLTIYNLDKNKRVEFTVKKE